MLDADVGRAVSALGADLGSSQTVAAWAGARGVFAATARVNGRFGVPQRLSRIGVGSDSAEILAANARGDALVLWQRSHPNDLGHGLAGPLFAAYRRAGERFAPARRIAGNALGGMVALDARGNAVIAWDQPSVRGGRPAIDVVDRDADGRYGPVSVIASGAVTLTGLAVDPAGQAVVVWDSGAFPATGIRAATCRPSGQCSAPVPIVPATVGARAGAVGSATASGGRSGLSALWAALQSSVEDRMTFDNRWTLADSRRFRFGLAAASKAGYRSSINPAAGR